MTKKPKLISSIRAKLVSAVAMLLVAVIMVVSSTYAWFTLSTAPEITGITTKIGANGALEMALVPEDGDLSTIVTYNPSGATVTDKNRTWGNLVDLNADYVAEANKGYGLNGITLYPAMLNARDGILENSMLIVPAYGPDGRVSVMEAKTVTGAWINGSTSFVENDKYGIRAIGVASGMTERELLFRNAINNATSVATAAKQTASASLSNNGQALADIALKHAQGSGSDVYTSAEVASLKAIVADLQGTDTKTGVLQYIESAYEYYILAVAATVDTVTDTELTALEAYMKSNTLTQFATEYATIYSGIPDGVKTNIEKLNDTIETVNTASEEINLLNGDAITWAQISTPLNRLANVEAIKINTVKASELGSAEKQTELAQSVGRGEGINVIMETGGGVYADVADHCGDYSARIEVNIVWGSLNLPNMGANMKTATTVDQTYLSSANSTVSILTPAGSTNGTANPITEVYGYIMDLAFRTNAANSKLMLQTEAEGRVYEDTETATTTMGHGSTMTFSGNNSGLTFSQISTIMSAVRIVFFQNVEGSNTVLYEARLDDLAEIKEDSDGDGTLDKGTGEYTASIYLYQNDALVKSENAALLDLPQNEAIMLSVLVYLDGTLIENDDVAAVGATSLTMDMNLQFSSDAELTPMEYSGIKNPPADAGNAEGAEGGN